MLITRTSIVAAVLAGFGGCGEGLPPERTDATGDVVALTDRQPEGRQVVAPQVDLRRATVRRDGERVLVDVELLAPLRPDGSLTVSFQGDGRPSSVTVQAGTPPTLVDSEGAAVLAPTKVERDGRHVRLELPSAPLRDATGWEVTTVDPKGFAVDALPDYDDDGPHPEVTIIR